MSAIPEVCRDGATSMSPDEIVAMAREIHGDWDVDGRALIRRRLIVEDFSAGLALINAVGALAEDHNHHPDLSITDYSVVTITLSTHDAGGLSANDFCLARHIDALIGRGD